MQIAVQEIGPEKAKELLELNTGNFRAVRKRRVAQYAYDMRHGLWEENGETIKLNGSELLDGQHRLLAVVASGATIRTAVAYNVDSTGMHIDEGAPRKITDWLRRLGLRNYTTLPAVAKLILCHEANRWNWNMPSNTDIPRNTIIDRCQADDERFQQAIRVAGAVKGRRLDIKTSLLAAVLYLGAESHQAKGSITAEWFAESLATGANLSQMEAVYHLREKAMASFSTQSNRWSGEVQRATICAAWNKTVLGHEVRMLRITATGPAKQQVQRVLMENES